MKLPLATGIITQKLQQRAQAKQTQKLLKMAHESYQDAYMKTRPMAERQEVFLRDTLNHPIKLIGKIIKSKVESLKK